MYFGMGFKLAENNKILNIWSGKEPSQIFSRISEEIYVKPLTQDLAHCKLAVTVSCGLLSPREEEMERLGGLPRAIQLEEAGARISIPDFIFIVQFFLHCAIRGWKIFTTAALLFSLVMSQSPAIQAYNFS